MIRPRLLLDRAEFRLLVDGVRPADLPPGVPRPWLLTGPLRAPAYQVHVQRHPIGLYQVEILTTSDRAEQLLARLVEINRRQLLAMGRGRLRIWKGLQDGTLWYQRRDPQEWWQTVRDLVRQVKAYGGAGADCEDWSTALAAESQLEGDPAEARSYRSGPRLWHVVTVSKHRGLRDPSRLGGMGLV